MRPISTLFVAVLTSSLAAQAPSAEFVSKDVLGKLSWRGIGPVNFGGRIVDIAVHPKKRAQWYVASATGGLFRTNNGGITFEPIFDKEKTIVIGDIDVAPSDPDVLWVGTGEANNQRSSYAGCGVFRSSDAGKTWSHVGLDGTDHISRVIAHPTNAEVAFVAAMGPLYTPGEHRGIYKTSDAGKTWKKTLYVDANTGFCDLALDPQNPDVLYAAGHECRRRAWHFTEGGNGGGIWKSKDGGETWSKLTGGLPTGILGRIGLAVFPADSKVLYAYVENRNPAPPQSEGRAGSETRGERTEREDGEAKENDNKEGAKDGKVAASEPVAYDDPAWDKAYWRAEMTPAAAVAADEPYNGRIKGGELYRSEDGGEKWTLVKGRLIGDRSSHYFYYFGQLRVHPQDDKRLWILDVSVHASTDGGKTWNTNTARRLHSDHHALWISPENPRHMLIGNDGGLAESFDGGDHWDHFDSLPLAQYYAIGVDMREPYRIYGGLQDNGTWGTPSRADNSGGLRREDTYRIGGGDGFYAVIDPTDPNTVYAESQFGALYRYDVRTGSSRSIRPRAGKGVPALRSNWSSPIALSPHNPHTVYFGTQFVHRSRNRGDTWEIISPDLTTADADKLSGNVPFCTITTLAESAVKAGVLWAGTDDGRVWVSKTGGERWTEVTERFPGKPAGIWVSRVEPSPFDANLAFVSFTGYRDDDEKPYLYMTEDGGETFKPIVNGLPNEPINVVRQHPRNEHVLFVGTDSRVHVSCDSGASWHPLQCDMPTQPIHDLVVHPREKDLIAGAHGRGLFIMDISALEELSDEILGKAVHAFAPRDGILLGRGASRGWPGQRTWTAQNGETRPVFWVYVREDLEKPISVAVCDATGKEVFTRNNIKDGGLHRIVWQAARAGGQGGRGARGGRRGGGGGAAADTLAGGQFALVVKHGEQTQSYPFTVRVAPGWAPGMQIGPEEADAPADTEQLQASERGRVIH